MTQVHRIAIALIVLLSINLVMSLDAQQYPPLRGRVNDYSKGDFLKPEEERALEARLADFEGKTSIQMVIAVVDSTNGEDMSSYATKLGTHWGIGQKGIDNGIVILWYPEGREIFIAPGYGIEPYLTDGKAGEILDTKVIPHFRNNQWYAGINGAVNGVIEHLGEMPWSVREDNRQIEAERTEIARKERAERNKALAWIVIQTASGILITVLSFWGIVSWNRRRIKRAEIRADLNGKLSEILSTTASLPQKLSYTLERLALETDKEHAKILHSQASEQAEAIRTQINSWLCNLKDPDTVKNEIAIYDFDAPSRITKEMELLAERYSRYLVEAPKKLEKGSQAYNASEEELQVLVKQGFKVWPNPAFEDASKLLIEARTKFKAHPSDPVTCIALIEKVEKMLAAEVDACKALPHLKRETEQRLSRCEFRAKEIAERQNSPEIKRLSQELQSICPDSIWRPLQENVNVITTKLLENADRFKTVKFLNSMDKQRFHEAAELMRSIEHEFNVMETSLRDLERGHAEQTTAKKDALGVLENSNLKVSSLQDIFSHADVSHTARSNYQTAKETLARLGKLINSSRILDWTKAVKDLGLASHAAEDAAELARSDVRNAEEERIRQRRDEDERRRQARLRAARASAARRRSSSSSSRSGFSGGGGRFGGGGAGRKY